MPKAIKEAKQPKQSIYALMYAKKYPDQSNRSLHCVINLSRLSGQPDELGDT